MASQQVVVRIPPELAAELERHVKRTRQRRSDVLRDALRAYLGKSTSRPRTHAENVAHLLGAFASGRPGMAEDTRRYVLESLRRGR